MSSIGGLMAFLGAGSFVLNMLEREFVLLMWIDTWGPTVGNAIRIGMIVVGGGLWLAGQSQGGAQEGDAA
ncbi:MAG: hypothetical protein MJE66_13960 [Proteobacteria bacterium]|nr:hypothetical protein [Pseudomonadota bacterium]